MNVTTSSNIFEAIADFFRDLFPGNTVGIPAPSVSLMMPPCTDSQLWSFLDTFKDRAPDGGMLLYELKFLIRKLGGLVYYLVRHTDLSDIMQKPHHVYFILLCL